MHDVEQNRKWIISEEIAWKEIILRWIKNCYFNELKI